VPEAGLPPVAVQANVTVPVPPDEDAVHATAVPTLPVNGQLIVTAKTTGGITIKVKVVIVASPPVAVPVIVIGNVPVGVLALVVTLI
jgi:hypothetical protein